MATDSEMSEMKVFEVGGGQVRQEGGIWHLALPAFSGTSSAQSIIYSDAQLYDYGGRRRADYPWRPGVRLRLEARFSHEAAQLAGTAGFGFWNAPYGDPAAPTWRERLPPLPQAVWFFLASPANDLPFAPWPGGHGWFAATLDAGTFRAMRFIPFSLPVVLLNRWPAARRRLWPWVRHQLGIEAVPINAGISTWRTYQIDWTSDGCRFLVDDHEVRRTPHAPRGPLGFVCWLDNQFLQVTPTGRFRAGALPLGANQWLEIRQLAMVKIDPGF